MGISEGEILELENNRSLRIDVENRTKFNRSNGYFTKAINKELTP